MEPWQRSPMPATCNTCESQTPTVVPSATDSAVTSEGFCYEPDRATGWLDLRTLSIAPHLRQVEIVWDELCGNGVPKLQKRWNCMRHRRNLFGLAHQPTSWDLTLRALPVQIHPLAALPDLMRLDVSPADIDDAIAVADLDVRVLLILTTEQWHPLRRPQGRGDAGTACRAGPSSRRSTAVCAVGRTVDAGRGQVLRVVLHTLRQARDDLLCRIPSWTDRRMAQARHPSRFECPAGWATGDGAKGRRLYRWTQISVHARRLCRDDWTAVITGPRLVPDTPPVGTLRSNGGRAEMFPRLGSSTGCGVWTSR